MRAKLAAAILIAGAFLSFVFLVAEHFSTGDVWAAASSQRLNREGTSVLYEALEHKGVAVNRNYQQPEDMDTRDSTILLLGLRPGVAEPKDFKMLETVASRGNRIVIALDAAAFRFYADARFAGEGLGAKDWNLKVHRPEGDDADDSDSNDDVWPLYFEHDDQWQEVLRLADHPIGIERKFGNGSIFMIAATQSFLNGALRDDRDSNLLEQTFGNAHRVVFVETHLGSVARGTVMGLIRRMRLGGVLAALSFAALLFFWRASVPFPPQFAESARDFTLPADGASTILVNLLERRIPPPRLITECVSQWARDCGRRAGAGRVEDVKTIAGVKGPATPAQWEEIRETLRGVRIT